MKWIRAKLARWMLPKCPTCGAMVEQQGGYCDDRCRDEDAYRQANSF